MTAPARRKPNDDRDRKGESKSERRRCDEALDEALEDTFPASDPTVFQRARAGQGLIATASRH